VSLDKLAISNHGLRNSGGIERYALTLVRGLHRRGVKPVLIAKQFDASLPEYQWVTPIHTSVKAAPGKLRDLFFDWRIGRVKKRLGLFPLIGCNQTRWSDIGICGGTHPGFLDAMGEQATLNDRWKIGLERAHLQNSRVIVAHSARMRDEVVRHYGIDPLKIALLYPPIDGERFSIVDPATRDALRRQLDLPNDRAVFLLASTGHKRKGLDLLVDFFSKTELPATLVIAGRAMHGSARNVRHLGYRADIENVYRAVRALRPRRRRVGAVRHAGAAGRQRRLCRGHQRIRATAVLARGAGLARPCGRARGRALADRHAPHRDTAARPGV
jgi:glycosyltransferase involved in cell wall biosynthesis